MLRQFSPQTADWDKSVRDRACPTGADRIQEASIRDINRPWQIVRRKRPFANGRPRPKLKNQPRICRLNPAPKERRKTFAYVPALDPILSSKSRTIRGYVRRFRILLPAPWPRALPGAIVPRCLMPI